MTIERAELLRKVILENKFKNLCELGFLHGKSSIYIGAILEEQGDIAEANNPLRPLTEAIP